MADADFEMQRHDRLPSIQATLSANLTTAQSVKFIMRKASADWVPDFTGSTTAKVNTTATIVSSADPTYDTQGALLTGSVVRYDWASIDTDTAGTYVGQWQVIWTAGSKPQTFPTKTYHTILIRADLDDA